MSIVLYGSPHDLNDCHYDRTLANELWISVRLLWLYGKMILLKLNLEIILYAAQTYIPDAHSYLDYFPFSLLSFLSFWYSYLALFL